MTSDPQRDLQRDPGAHAPASTGAGPAATCRLVRDEELAPADPTPGMSRRLAFTSAGMWSGTVDTEAGAVSGWHHHGEHETTLYVVAGVMRLEFGPDGTRSADAGPGDFLHVPAGVVHRESNPGPTTSRAVVVRCGSGEPTTNVAGPG